MYKRSKAVETAFTALLSQPCKRHHTICNNLQVVRAVLTIINKFLASVNSLYCLKTFANFLYLFFSLPQMLRHIGSAYILQMLGCFFFFFLFDTIIFNECVTTNLIMTWCSTAKCSSNYLFWKVACWLVACFFFFCCCCYCCLNIFHTHLIQYSKTIFLPYSYLIRIRKFQYSRSPSFRCNLGRTRTSKGLRLEGSWQSKSWHIGGH